MPPESPFREEEKLNYFNMIIIPFSEMIRMHSIYQKGALAVENEKKELSLFEDKIYQIYVHLWCDCLYIRIMILYMKSLLRRIRR